MMRHRAFAVVLVRIGCLTLTAMACQGELHAQRASTAPLDTVLFVCEHGTVKSLLAKLLFEQYAAQVGLRVAAISRGTAADSAVAPWMRSALATDHFSLGAWRPTHLATRDLARAAYVVTFDLPPSIGASARAPHEQWDNLPSVAQHYDEGRDAIGARVRHLVDSLQRARSATRSRRAPAASPRAPTRPAKLWHPDRARPQPTCTDPLRLPVT